MKNVLTICVLVMLATMAVSCTVNKENEKSSGIDNTTLKKIQEIENEHNITMIYSEAQSNEFINEKIEIVREQDDITAAVEAAETIFSRLPENWAEKISNIEAEIDGVERIQEVCVVFCEETEILFEGQSIEYNLGADAFVSEGKLYLLVDIHNFDPKVSLARAFFAGLYIKVHNDGALIEANQIKENGVENYRTINDIFEAFNPEDFQYGEPTEKYLYHQDNVKNVYFTCKEAMYSIQLDYVLTMSPLLYTDEGEKLPVEFSKNVIEKAFQATWGMTYVFNTSDVYWNIMIENYMKEVE